MFISLIKRCAVYQEKGRLKQSVKKTHLDIIISVSVCFVISVILISQSINKIQTDQQQNKFDTEKILFLEPGWQYRWGDSPLSKQGLPVWLNDKFTNQNWCPTMIAANIPDRKGDHLWLRIKLPEQEITEGYLFLKLVLEVFEVYVEDRLIYQFGNPGMNQKGNKYYGWPWHIIKLPANYKGKTVAFRIYSQHPKIGIIGKPIIAKKHYHINTIVTTQIDQFVLGFIFLFMGLFLIFQFLRDMESEIRAGYFSLGGFALLVGIFTISKAGSDLKQLFYNSPLFWSYLEMISLYFLPIGLVSYLEKIFEKKKIFSYLWKIHLSFAGISFVLVIANIISLSSSILYFLILFIVTITMIICLTIVAAIKGNTEARYFIIAITVLASLMIIDSLIAIGVINSHISFSHWGLFLFFITLAFILGRRYNIMNHQMQEYYHKLELANKELYYYNEDLETIIAQRTKELNDSMQKLALLNETLHQLSIIDGLTGIINRRHFDNLLKEEWRRHHREKQSLALIMIDIDHFKIFNDSYGHPKGDELLKKVSKTLKEIIKRPSDVIARYGGEEFVVILPKTDLTGAYNIAESMRLAVEKLTIEVNHKIKPCPVTISLGVASIIPKNNEIAAVLISKADSALYKAKAAGRNQVKTVS